MPTDDLTAAVAELRRLHGVYCCPPYGKEEKTHEAYSEAARNLAPALADAWERLREENASLQIMRIDVAREVDRLADLLADSEGVPVQHTLAVERLNTILAMLGPTP